MQAAAVVPTPPVPRSTSSVIPATTAKFLSFNFPTTQALKKRQLHFTRVNYRQIQMATASPSPPSVGTAPKWAQKTITIPAQRRGCHLITSKVLIFLSVFDSLLNCCRHWLLNWTFTRNDFNSIRSVWISCYFTITLCVCVSCFVHLDGDNFICLAKIFLELHL